MAIDSISAEDVAAQVTTAAAFAHAAAILARLRRVPDGCPWDLAQTMESIKPHTLEEVYEVFDAIDRRAWVELQDELGDLLLQVLFYAQIGRDEGHFTMEDVARSLSAKLLRRHPHIFGDIVAQTPADVVQTWERVKQTERADAAVGGLLDAVPRAMGGLVEARKLGAKAAKVGFDWPDAAGLFDKLAEEAAEVRMELAAPVPNAHRVEEQIGDLLFTVANLARHLSVDPEQALKKANRKFRSRFARMEALAGDADALSERSAEALESLWCEAKKAECRT